MTANGYEKVSPPARGRGLKHKCKSYRLNTKSSPPARGRGLKPKAYFIVNSDRCRPPRGGVD